MADEEKLHSLIHSTFEALVVGCAVSVDTAQEQGRPPLASEHTLGELRRYPVQYRFNYRTHATSQTLWKQQAGSFQHPGEVRADPGG